MTIIPGIIVGALRAVAGVARVKRAIAPARAELEVAGAQSGIMQTITTDNSFATVVAFTDQYSQAVTLSGGGDAKCLRTGNPIGGARPEIRHFGPTPTLSYTHTQRNLSVGMEFAGDTKPTIAQSIFAAHFESFPCGAAIGPAPRRIVDFD